MGKQITSPVKKFSGSITIKDPLPYPDFIAWEKGFIAEEDRADKTNGEKESSMWSGVLAVVEKWELQNFDPENIPATPRLAVINLLTWIVKEVGLIINEVEDIPKG